MKKQYFIVLGFILIVGLILVGCASNSTTTTKAPAPASTTASQPAATTPKPSIISPTASPAASLTPKYGGTLTFIADQGPAGNIGWPAGTFTMVPQYFLYDSLLKAWWDGHITPELATSWDVDTTTPAITFHLRQGVKFHDGTDFNAQAVKFNFGAMIDAKARPAWKQVDVIDDYTVKVTLTKWQNSAVMDFDGNPFVSPTAVSKNGVDWIKLNPVGTGPFMFGSYAQDDRLIVKKNPNYWDKGLPYLDTFQVVYIPDFQTEKAAMQQKQGDIVLAEFGEQTSEYASLKSFNIFAQPQATAFMVFDDLNTDSPFYDLKVRQAVDYAIDRSWIATNLGYGYWQPCYQLPPRNNSVYDPNYAGRKYDPAKAKQLLTDAGYPNGFKTQLIPNPTALNKDIWVAVQQQLAQVGITAELKFTQASDFAQYRNTGTWKNAIIGDNMPSFGNMNEFVGMDFQPGGIFFQSMNKARPDWVAAWNASSTAPTYDPTLVQKACAALYNNASVIPIAEGGRGYVYQPYVMNAGFGQRAAYFWAWAWDQVWLNK
jgi:ABC-type transport system substrate-binding protein